MPNSFIILGSADGEININRTPNDDLLIKGKDLKVVSAEDEECGVKTFLILETKDGKIKINRTIRKDLFIQGKDIKIISNTKEGETINGRSKNM